MARFHHTLLLPGNQVTDAEQLLAGHIPPPDSQLLNAPLVSFTATFADGYRMAIEVIYQGPDHLQLRTTLFNHADAQVDSADVPGGIDQDFCLEDGDSRYEVSVLRAASTVLTPAAITAYNSRPAACPACGSTDLHCSPPQIDGPVVQVAVECCACGAEWADLYGFETISTEASDWTPPTRNVARTPSE